MPSSALSSWSGSPASSRRPSSNRECLSSDPGGPPPGHPGSLCICPLAHFEPVNRAGFGQDTHLSPVRRGRFFHRTVPEPEAKISPLLPVSLTHLQSICYGHSKSGMGVLGFSFPSNFDATVPFPSSPPSCLMGQVSRLDLLVKGSHPSCVGRFKAGDQLSPAVHERGGGSG